MRKIDFGIRTKALLGDISECGDIGIVREYDAECFLALIDVLGHGAEARTVAVSAEEYLNHNYRKEPETIMLGLHEHLKGSRGAVAAVCSLDIGSGRLKYVGIGNITVRIFGPAPIRFVSREGILGYGCIKPHPETVTLMPGDLFLMHSDGIKEHFDVIECTKLFKERSEIIAAGIMGRFRNQNDDSSCIVLKYLK